jgi:hypothetical protein
VRRRPLLFGIVGVVVVAALAVVAVVVLLKATGLPTGPGTATMTWTLPAPSAHPAPTAFSGTVDDRAVTGTATAAATAVKGSGGSSSLDAARWTGSFGGTSFDLREKVTVGQPPPSSATNKFLGGFSLDVHVTGTFGSQTVNIKATRNPLQAGRPLPFSGTVGDLHVKGKVTSPKENGEIRSVTATFTVTKSQ